MDPSPKFPSTPWTKLRAAVDPVPTAQRTAAINDLCSYYWYPLYAFARWRGCTHEDAQDQTQIFLHRLIERNSLENADASKGRLRSYLLGAFRNQLINSWEHSRCARSGGLATIHSMEMPGAEQRFALETPDPSLSPEEQFDRVWAQAVLDACLTGMAAEYTRNGQAELFASLRPFLNPVQIADACMAHAAQKLGMSDTALRQRVFRLRGEFARALRAHVAALLNDPTPQEIDEEMQSLRRALEKS
jgi:DNA-directed RNA polymerase specialized sigma24 family protein